VVLINGEDRVLLLDVNFELGKPDGGHGWITPGGGVDDGEELAAAAVRELFEETGLRVPVDGLGAHIAFASGLAESGAVAGRFRDDYFMHRVARHNLHLGGMLDYEVANLRGVRWWSVDELANTTEQIVPSTLLGLLRRLLDGDVPREPIELPWDG
jgi:8-oxo-dGTP pyrophosphatase MutT (NUDIX family)